MNFKPTRWKTIACFIVGLTVLVYVIGGMKCKVPDECGLLGIDLFFAIICATLVYVVWSLIQKK